ncbi:uncharacterized protein LOC118470775 isoform X2 [Amphiprion ocellaris]|uniref:uncharacterized protein LOC118470775 isoform X2 n=1 Tax=Amphiprion ocellaris TaxID=80972 RepID=UPI002410E58F|nr:uncharacterized protein LOC118470775 isoform X2 [Amphiprion ocellaris]
MASHALLPHGLCFPTSGLLFPRPFFSVLCNPAGEKRMWQQLKMKYKNIVQTANRKKADACKKGGGPAPPVTEAEELLLSQNLGRPVAEGIPGGSSSSETTSQDTSKRKRCNRKLDLPSVLVEMQAEKERNRAQHDENIWLLLSEARENEAALQREEMAQNAAIPGCTGAAGAGSAGCTGAAGAGSGQPVSPPPRDLRFSCI